MCAYFVLEIVFVLEVYCTNYVSSKKIFAKTLAKTLFFRNEFVSWCRLMVALSISENVSMRSAKKYLVDVPLSLFRVVQARTMGSLMAQNILFKARALNSSERERSGLFVTSKKTFKLMIAHEEKT